MATSVEFRDSDKSLSATLADISQSLPPDHVTIRDLLALIGEQGMLFFCIILTIPFLTPIPLPGVSTVFGLLIMLISLGVIANRVPWLPAQILNRHVSSSQLSAVLARGSQLFVRVERFIRPRMLALTRAGSTNRLNGVVLLVAGFLLILPFPMIPFSNTFPGWAVLLLAIGMLQRDGVFVVGGYIMTLISTLYFGAWAVAVIVAGQSLSTLFQEPAIILLPYLF